MKVVIQKSGKASVEVAGKITGQIEKGLVVLLGITNGDTEKDVDFIADKIANLRLFDEGEKYFEKSVTDTTKEILLISQFTLYGDCRKGRRPDFINAAKAEVAEPLYNKLIEKLKSLGLNVQTGVFRAMMKVSLTNEGPITIILDSNLTN
ncbi:MAG: D-aminoacyl-tRNA deacylase [Candidatus Gracilibacteria bacterium]